MTKFFNFTTGLIGNLLKLDDWSFRHQLLGLGALLTAVLVFFGWLSLHAMTREVEATAGESNRTLATSFANQNWAELEHKLLLGYPAQDLQNNPGLPVIDSAVRRFARGTDLVMVKIFDARGSLVYSTDRSQIGQDRSKSEGFLRAVKGSVATELTHRNTFSGFDGELTDRDLVSSYVPIRGEQGVEAVLELYADRTKSVDSMRRQMWMIVPLFGAILLLPFAAVGWWLRRMNQRQIEQQQRMQVMSDALQDHQRQTDAASLDKCNFLRGVVEELAYPMERLAELSQELLKQTAQTPAASQAHELTENLRSLDARIRDFQTLVQLYTGSILPRIEPTDIGACVRQVGLQLEQAAQSKGIKTTVFVAPETEGLSQTDSSILNRILQILVDNALEHTHQGHIQLRLQPGAGGIQIDVIDTGSGIPAEQLQTLFNSAEPPRKFQTRMSHFSDAAQLRISLSLSIAEGLTQLLRGRIQVQSILGSGSWFSVWLPLQLAQSTNESANPVKG